MPLVTFPTAQWPLAGGDPPNDEWFKWFSALDRLLRATDGAAFSTLFEALGVSAGINTQTSNYILALTDKGKTIEMNLAGANTLTIPPNSSVAFPIGTYVNFTQLGAGQTTLTPGSGVQLNSRNGLKTAGTYAIGTLYKRATDGWIAGGDLTT